jgi:flavin reductase (DIM6/NTAB) family NADH-FMN oxidoreductase RutF
MSTGNALHKLSNGYYIITAIKPAEELETRDKDYIAAAIINWASQLSFDPLQIGVSVQVDSHLNETIDYSEGFTLHVLSEKQSGLVDKFSGDSEITDEHINGHPYKLQDGQIILEDTLAFIECKLKDSVRMGDHTLHVGQVINDRLLKDEAPLTTSLRPSEYQGNKFK